MTRKQLCVYSRSRTLQRVKVENILLPFQIGTVLPNDIIGLWSDQGMRRPSISLTS
jgi:hypothetical protein